MANIEMEEGDETLAATAVVDQLDPIVRRFSRVQFCEGIVSDRDKKIIWDGGKFFVKKGEWLMLTDTGELFSCANPVDYGYLGAGNDSQDGADLKKILITGEG